MINFCDTFRIDYKGLGKLIRFLRSPANFKNKADHKNNPNNYILFMGSSTVVNKNGSFHECVVSIYTKSEDSKISERKLKMLHNRLFPKKNKKK